MADQARHLFIDNFESVLAQAVTVPANGTPVAMSIYLDPAAVTDLANRINSLYAVNSLFAVPLSIGNAMVFECLYANTSTGQLTGIGIALRQFGETLAIATAVAGRVSRRSLNQFAKRVQMDSLTDTVFTVVPGDYATKFPMNSNSSIYFSLSVGTPEIYDPAEIILYRTGGGIPTLTWVISPSTKATLVWAGGTPPAFDASSNVLRVRLAYINVPSTADPSKMTVLGSWESFTV